MAKFNLLSASDLSSLIKGVKDYGAKFDAKVQGAAAQCIAQSILHSNVTPANELLGAMPKGSRRDSLVAHFEKFGNIAWMKAEKKLVFSKVHAEYKTPAEWTPEYAESVLATMWTLGTTPPAIRSTYDLETEFGKMFDRLGKVMDDSTKKVEHRDLYAKLKAVYNSHVAGTLAAQNDPQEEVAA